MLTITCVWGGGRSSGVVLVFIMIVLGLRQSWGGCVSSCGKIGNINYPFRLKDDPHDCGENRYELECINQVVVLRLFSGEYYVESINYNDYTIRLVDPNIQHSDCSSLPRYLLSIVNFSDNEYDAYRATQIRDYSTEQLFRHIIYLDCPTPVRSDEYPYNYVNTSDCLDDPNIYAIEIEYNYFPVSSLKNGCHVKLVAPISKPKSTYYGYTASYRAIHSELLYGFELSWLHASCDSHCGFRPCFFNTATQSIQCHSADHGINWGKFYHNILDILAGIMYGILAAITLGKIGPIPNLRQEIIGRYVLAPFLFVRLLLGVTLVISLLLFKWRRRHLSMNENIEHFLQHSNLNPIRYSYREIKKMTNGFKVKLGEGGFGSVYKGKLRSGPYVAIKMLSKSKANGQDFISEVATIGRIHHVNVVRLVGFCVEGTKRALVYEFMPNGSLDKFIFSREGSIPLSYQKIYEISLGVARGISYLHQGCDMQILHFDIKPHNILLDDNFIPKVSDFGLARLYPVDHSIVTLTAARGIIGYMAPELFYKNIGGVSYKADVYSFGMLLMEMAGRRKNLNPHAEHSSQLYFPFWIYDQFNEEKDVEMEDLTKEEKDLAKKMFVVALWCIQLKPSDRPSMNKVVQMLEAEFESLEMPPKPSLYPHETVAGDQGFSSDQMETSGSTSSTNYIVENVTDHSVENNA